MQRNYILARGMQVPRDKDLQNDMRIIASQQKNVAAHNIFEEQLNSIKIVSGVLSKPGELNNVHHLVGLMPPIVEAAAPYDIEQTLQNSRIDR